MASLEEMGDESLCALQCELSSQLAAVEQELERRRAAALEREMQRRVDEQLREAALCKACMLVPRDTVFIPCGHIFACEGCAMRVECCPVCRVEITMRQRAFVS